MKDKEPTSEIRSSPKRFLGEIKTTKKGDDKKNKTEYKRVRSTAVGAQMPARQIYIKCFNVGDVTSDGYNLARKIQSLDEK